MSDDLKRLAADLTGAGTEATRRASQVIRKTAFDLVSAAKPFARVDTGALRNSIGADVAPLSAVVGPTVHYGPHQEFGTRYQTGTHYMSRGTDIVTPAFVAAMEQAGVDPIVGDAS